VAPAAKVGTLCFACNFTKEVIIQQQIFILIFQSADTLPISAVQPFQIRI